MTVTGVGYGNDQVDELAWSQLCDFFAFEGVIGLAVAPTAADRTVSVTFTRAHGQGILVTQSGADTVQAAANTSSFTRHDLVILKHDFNANTSTVTVKQGVPASAPQVPTLTRTPGVTWEQPLARLAIAPGQGALASGDVTLWATSRNSPVILRPDTVISAPPESELALVFTESTGALEIGTGSAYREITRAKSTISSGFVLVAGWSNQGDFKLWREGSFVTGVGTVRRSGATIVANADSNILDTKVGTLPSGWRPTQTWSGAWGDGYGVGEYRIDTNGDVWVRSTSHEKGIEQGADLRFHFHHPVVA